ncbi:MAG: rod shape-determining protein [Lachnospiraceae bacterium]|nr:rod shape-determining protein [Lachnospiraceae bacterium]
MLFQKVCGIDLGTDTIKLKDKSGKRFLYSKNLLAMRQNGQVLAIGDAAYEIYEKNPENVRVVWPMAGGVIANLTEMEIVLSHLLKSFAGIGHTGASLCIAVPSDITQVEKRAFFMVMHGKINAGSIRLIDKGIADAVSAGLPVLSSRGHMVVNIGADTTEIAVIASGKVILSQTLKVGGRRLDEDIATMVRRKFNLSIGQKTAEALKNNLAFMINGPRLEQKVFGIHTLSGLPKSDMIPSLAVSVAIIDSIDYIIENIKAIYNRVPPQLMKDITREGIYLTGGVSMILNLPEYIRREIGIPLHHIQDPKNSTIRGLVEILNNKDLRQFTYSLNDLTGMR